MGHIMKISWFLACLCISITTVAQPVAKVLFTSGKVTATRNGKAQMIQRGANLSVGDVIETYGNAEARFRYNNGSLVTLSLAANYQILKYEPKQNVEIEAKLNRGKAHILTEGNRKKKEILRTNVVAMAILGTDVTVNTCTCTNGNKFPKPLSKKQLHACCAGKNFQVIVKEGEVSVSGTMLKPGVRYTVAAGSNGGPPVITPQRPEGPGLTEIIDNTTVGNLGQIISTGVAVNGGATSAVTSSPTATLVIICP